MRLTVDFSSVTGTVKPVHGFNNAARKTGYGELLPEFLSLKPPIVRLHDTCGFYGGAHYVDIPNVFPDFNADPEDENAYDFTLTDRYIEPLIAAGCQVMYRLGVTIEHAPKKYHVFPPKDPEKWADICEHIVRHYNNGWNNGYFWGIQYWEIWNEPDGLHPKVEPNGPPMWNGTAEEYYRLYSITAGKIKALHPEVSVGGYSSCYILGAFTDNGWQPGPTGFFTGFLSYITDKKTKAPLDFFSYHGYLGKNYLEKIETEYTFVKSTLTKFGFSDTLIFNTEWNTNIAVKEREDRRTEYYINMRNENGASHAAGALFEMQRLGIDAAMFYDAQLWWEYGCLFHVPSLTPTKTYYAFLHFAEMYALKNACRVVCDKGIYASAAKNENKAILGVSNITDTPVTVRLTAENCPYETVRMLQTDAQYTDTQVRECLTAELTEFALPPHSFVFFVYT